MGPLAPHSSGVLNAPHVIRSAEGAISPVIPAHAEGPLVKGR